MNNMIIFKNEGRNSGYDIFLIMDDYSENFYRGLTSKEMKDKVSSIIGKPYKDIVKENEISFRYSRVFHIEF